MCIRDRVVTIKQSYVDPEREALIALYKATNGDNWTNNTNWCSDKPVCIISPVVTIGCFI